MINFLHQLSFVAPHFAIIALGFMLVRFARLPKNIVDRLTRFVFLIALPAMLFRLMSNLAHLPSVDTRLLVAFFGSCMVVFVIGRVLGVQLFKLDGKAQSVFALGGVFSNNVLLGIPLANAAFGAAAMPSVALILIFNALTLWTLVTASVEWSIHGEFSISGFGKTAKAVATNPIVASIVSGALFGFAGVSIPTFIDAPLALLAQTAAPLALLSLGMGLAEYGIASHWHQSLAICFLKLTVQPLTVWLLATALGLPAMETQVIVLLAGLPVGVNVYLMARQFNTMEAAVASSLVASSVLATITVPVTLTLLVASRG